VKSIRYNRLITCVLPVGTARVLVEVLKNRKGIITTNFYHARGVGSAGTQRSSFAAQLERDVLEVLVTRRHANELFDYLYEMTGIYEPHRGIMYMERVGRATDFRLFV